MRTLARNDRHVLHGRMRIRPGAPAHTLVFNVEEALRLCSLPGENEGRVYYFRRLDVTGVPENGDRQPWLAAFQNALLELARSAVYGRESAARSADAVYFRDEQEACESLITSILRRRPTDEWFWRAISGSEPGASGSEQIVRTIRKLSRSESSWMAVAAAVFAVGDPAPLLHLVPAEVAREWVRDLGARPVTSLTPTPGRLPERTLRALAQAASLLGFEDPRVVWLASLAVILAYPSEMESAAAVPSARLSLRALKAVVLSREIDRTLPAKRVERRVFPDPEPRVDAPERLAGSDTVGIERPDGEPEADLGLQAAGLDPALTEVPPLDPAPAEPFAATAEEEPEPEIAIHRDPHRVQRTEGAGLYFLLNALKYLGAAESGIDPPFLARLFQRIGRFAGLDDSDPILLWTLTTLEEHPDYPIDERALRIRLWELRRWCWRNGKIPLREVVRRPGAVTLTRTDLDVTLPLESADIRIRRVGLDLDPGWLPWFGRVVRFHYVGQGEMQ